MNKSELDHVWHSVTSALEKEFWTRGWFSPQAARIEQLEAALRENQDYLLEFGDPGHVSFLIRRNRTALAPEQDK